MKKLTSIFLVLMLVLSLLPVGVLAQEGEETLDSAEQSDTLLAENVTNEPVEEATEEITETVSLALDGTDATPATSGTCGANVAWSFDSTNGTLTISGTGAMACYEEASDAPWNAHFFQITSVKIEDGVQINAALFAAYSSLASIFVNESNANYKSVDGVLFDKNGTTLIQYPAGKQDTSYTIPNTVTRIAYGAFMGCSHLTSVTIPDNVINIVNEAFYGCTALTSVTLSANLTKIADSTFGGCSSLKTVVIPNKVTSIEGLAFNKCNALESITIPASVTTIGDYTFNGCSELENVYYAGTENAWKAITEQIKNTNDGLRNATIHYNYDSGGSGGSGGQEEDSDDSNACGENLTWSFENGKLTISGTGAMDNYSGTGKAPWCAQSSSITSVEIGAGVTSIGSNAFGSCSALTDVYYAGTAAQWAEIEKGDNNAPLTSATVHYNTRRNEDGSTTEITVTVDEDAGTTTTTETTVVGNKTTVVTTTERTDSTGGTTATVTKNVTDKTNNVTTTTQVDSTTATTTVTLGDGTSPANMTVDATAVSATGVTGAEVKLPAKALNDAANDAVETVVVKTDVATVTINNSALKTMTKDAEESKNLVLAVGKTDRTTNTAKGIYATYELTAQIDGNDVFTEGGVDDVVTISVNYALSNPNYDVLVYYVDGRGERQDMKAEFKDGILTWNTNHFSTFVVVEQAKAAQPDTKPEDTTKPAAKTTDAKKPPRTGDESHAALWLAVALLGGCAVVGTTVIAKKKKYSR